MLGQTFPCCAKFVSFLVSSVYKLMCHSRGRCLVLVQDSTFYFHPDVSVDSQVPTFKDLNHKFKS